MSWLAPLYLAGLAALSLPLWFHLIRRVPSGRTPFSSLLFLKPSPPRSVRRRRLDQILLLLLRAAALALLAGAFARPFWREASRDDASASSGRARILLVDTSASMRREGVWDEVQAAAERFLDDTQDGERLALWSFDTGVSRRAGGNEGATASEDPGRAVLRQQLRDLEPGWRAADLGAALVEAADHLARSEIPGADVVVISDLAEGSALEALDDFDWPDAVRCEFRRVGSVDSNATIEWSASPLEDADPAERWVRISNGADASEERFELRWLASAEDEAEAEGPGEAAVHFVPAGETRVVRAPPRPVATATVLELSGDDESFDNRCYDGPARPHRWTVLSLGVDIDTERGLDFYLDRVFGDRRGMSVELIRGDESSLSATDRIPMAIWKISDTEAGGASRVEALRRFADEGGLVLAVLARLPDDAAACAALLADLLGEEELQLSEAESSRRHHVLRDIDFGHPMFEPFAPPQYRDFSRIHFWRHRLVAGAQASRVIAAFDDDQPFLLERRHGRGRILLATAGWHPRDSDLARSSKFPPLMVGLLQQGPALRPVPSRFLVGDRVPLAAWQTDEGLSIVDPAGERHERGPEELWFETATRPGLHRVLRAGGTEEIGVFAVQLDPREGRLEPLDPDELEGRGVSLEPPEGAESEGERRQRKDAELESDQKLWRWLVIAALVAVLIETLWASRATRLATIEA